MREKSVAGKILTFVCVLLIVEFVCSLCLGKYPLTAEKLLSGDARAVRVFWTLRLPRTCMAVLGGFGLGAAGMVYQTVFRNPLASPDIIGVSSGASAGAAFAILFISAAAVPVTISAFAGGLLAVVLALCLASLAPKSGKASVVLAGITVQALAQTLLMILKLTADPEKELASIEYWIMGSLSGVTMSKLPASAVICIAGTVLLFVLYRQILILSVEEEEARMLGVLVGKMRLLVLLLATLTVASVISVTGLIAFIGLLAPHIARMVLKTNNSAVFCLSGIVGGLLLCAADMLARSVSPGELPVSVFTSLLGAPFLIYLMLRREERT